MDTRFVKGRRSEECAERYLEAHGLKILVRNYRCPIGEIDLIGRDGKALVFIEVKSRFGRGFGVPQESVSWSKQRRLTRLAQWYLKEQGTLWQPARFDVVAITWIGEEPEINWIPNAFDARE